MKTQDTNTAATKNVIDATAALRPERPKMKLLKKPVLDAEDGKIIDLYIAARRREQAAVVAADELKPRVLQIV
jgi:hypothetical protein